MNQKWLQIFHKWYTHKSNHILQYGPYNYNQLKFIYHILLTNHNFMRKNYSLLRKFQCVLLFFSDSINFFLDFCAKIFFLSPIFFPFLNVLYPGYPVPGSGVAPPRFRSGQIIQVRDWMGSKASPGPGTGSSGQH